MKLRTGVLSCVLLVAVACHHRVAPEVEADANSGEVAIQVINHNFADIVISIDENGRRTRLGLAGGESTTLWSLPWRRVATTGTLRLDADPIGASTMIRTDLLSVRPGSIVVWTIESRLVQSNAAVY